MTDPSKKSTEFAFRGTPAQAKAMREALRPYVERKEVKILLATAADLAPLEVAETIRVLESAKHHEETCKFIRELLVRSGAST